MKKIIVTGATGLIGSHVIDVLLQNSQIYAVSRSLIDRPHKNVSHLQLDFLGETNLAALPKSADAIIYLAQSDDFRDFPEKSLNIFDINVKSVMAFLEYGRRAGIKKFILASTGGVYNKTNRILRESDSIKQAELQNFYSATKICSEILTSQFLRISRICSCLLEIFILATIIKILFRTYF